MIVMHINDQILIHILYAKETIQIKYPSLRPSKLDFSFHNILYSLLSFRVHFPLHSCYLLKIFLFFHEQQQSRSFMSARLFSHNGLKFSPCPQITIQLILLYPHLRNLCVLFSSFIILFKLILVTLQNSLPQGVPSKLITIDLIPSQIIQNRIQLINKTFIKILKLFNIDNPVVLIVCWD